MKYPRCKTDEIPEEGTKLFRYSGVKFTFIKQMACPRQPLAFALILEDS